MFRPNHFLTPANWHVLGMKKLLQKINNIANNGHRTQLQTSRNNFVTKICYDHSPVHCTQRIKGMKSLKVHLPPNVLKMAVRDLGPNKQKMTKLKFFLL